MPLRKFIVIPLIVAALAFLIQCVDQVLHVYAFPFENAGFGWIAFISWAMYFMAGCTVNGGIKVFLNYISGIIASVAIMTMGGQFAPALGFFAFPVAVFIVVIFCILLEKTEWFNFIPALFVGAGTYFGFMSYVPGATFLNAGITEMIYCTLGLIFGYATVYLRGNYEAHVEKQEHEEHARSHAH